MQNYRERMTRRVVDGVDGPQLGRKKRWREADESCLRSPFPVHPLGYGKPRVNLLTVCGICSLINVCYKATDILDSIHLV
ncbi:unnamed protein product [Phytomonas sp. Hart1]|nr:unnamed protein product [Phytomonas sp. Hart1]|eukprot:CCW67838.1 unnamed protein product [Phytomonas sp. isolate Hart1]